MNKMGDKDIKKGLWIEVSFASSNDIIFIKILELGLRVRGSRVRGSHSTLHLASRVGFTIKGVLVSN